LQAYNDLTRAATDNAHRAKVNEAFQVLSDPFKRVEYDNFIQVQKWFRFGARATVFIVTGMLLVKYCFRERVGVAKLSNTALENELESQTIF
jgi:curved DNA-binding protein CbpA